MVATSMTTANWGWADVAGHHITDDRSRVTLFALRQPADRFADPKRERRRALHQEKM